MAQLTLVSSSVEVCACRFPSGATLRMDEKGTREELSDHDIFMISDGSEPGLPPQL